MGVFTWTLSLVDCLVFLINGEIARPPPGQLYLSGFVVRVENLIRETPAGPRT